jgi:hypothetical protein
MRSHFPLAPQKKLRPWHFAGLLTTYWCNARCAFCYVHGSPDQCGTMPPEDAVRFWQQLDAVAAIDGRHIRVHIAGGEPFGKWENLIAILRAAGEAGLPAVQKIETNAFWAVDDRVTRERLTELRHLGVGRMDVSTDVFHQEFVGLDCVQRCVRIAREVFGPGGVRVRWEDCCSTDSPAIVMDKDRADRNPTFVEALRRHPERMTGRAAFTVAPLLACRPAEEFLGQHCIAELLKSKHVHVGPEGAVFPGVCSGILLGNARTEPLDRMWHRLSGHWQEEPILAPLIHEGPVALCGMARRHGYQPLPGYATKCHLCTHVRQYMFALGLWPEHLGPSALYQTSP